MASVILARLDDPAWEVPRVAAPQRAEPRRRAAGWAAPVDDFGQKLTEPSVGSPAAARRHTSSLRAAPSSGAGASGGPEAGPVSASLVFSPDHRSPALLHSGRPIQSGSSGPTRPRPRCCRRPGSLWPAACCVRRWPGGADASARGLCSDGEEPPRSSPQANGSNSSYAGTAGVKVLQTKTLPRGLRLGGAARGPHAPAAPRRLTRATATPRVAQVISPMRISPPPAPPAPAERPRETSSEPAARGALGAARVSESWVIGPRGGGGRPSPRGARACGTPRAGAARGLRLRGGEQPASELQKPASELQRPASELQRPAAELRPRRPGACSAQRGGRRCRGGR